MGKRLYVGGLPYSTTSEDLQELFGSAGVVKTATVISDRETGRSKGFGFVEMEEDEGFDAAIKAFDGYKLENRTLTVNEAKPQETNRPKSNYGSSRY